VTVTHPHNKQSVESCTHVYVYACYLPGQSQITGGGYDLAQQLQEAIINHEQGHTLHCFKQL